MTRNVLIVHPDSGFWTDFFAEIKRSITEISLYTAGSRVEATTIAGSHSFDHIVMSLEIPRLSDGYLLIGRVLSKAIAKNRIIVLVKHKTDAIISSLHSLEVEHIYTYDDKEAIIDTLTSSVRKKTTSSAPAAGNTTTDATKPIYSALCNIMGPVGAVIYKKATLHWQNTSDLNALITLITNEIGDKQQSRRFHALLQEQKEKAGH
jgi:hypothetical protein